MSLDLFRLDKKVVVVSGGLGKLGRQFTSALIGVGARVAVLDIAVSRDLAQDSSQQHSRPDNPLLIHCDITRRSSIEKAYIEIVQTMGVPSGLVNNAALDSPPSDAVGDDGRFENYPESNWDKVMDVNVKGVFLLCQVFGSEMAALGRGSVINISSTYGVVSPNQSIYKLDDETDEQFFKPVSYSASKSALLNMTRYLSTHWGRNNVRVNTMVLGGMFNDQESKFVENYCRLTPLGRMAKESEYCGGLIFLLSDSSSYMTGANLVMDGGWTAW